MAGLADGSEVGILVAAAASDSNDVVHLVGWCAASVAASTVASQDASPDLFPIGRVALVTW
jgi:hypothetical protein